MSDFVTGLMGRFPGDMFFSPVNIRAVLGMMAVGARGKTREEMLRVLGFEGWGDEKIVDWIAALAESASQRVTLEAANRIYVQESERLLESYLRLMGRMAGVEQVDFLRSADQVRDAINRWVAEKTHDRIVKLLAPGTLGRSTRLALVSAIYFKGDWRSQFNLRDTAPEVFHGVDGDAKVPMMRQVREGIFGYRDLEWSQVVDIPYVGDQMAMVVILPREGVSLPEAEQRLDREIWPLLGGIRPYGGGLDLAMPRFEMRWGTVELTNALMGMGMPLAFDPRADFGGMTDPKGLFVSNVYHQAWVMVDEKGTEAAAATAATMMRGGVQRPVTVRVDRPFLYVIRKGSEAVFVGRKTKI